MQQQLDTKSLPGAPAKSQGQVQKKGDLRAQMRGRNYDQQAAMLAPGGAPTQQVQQKKAGKKPAAPKATKVDVAEEEVVRSEMYDLAGGSMKDVCQDFVKQLTDTVNLTVMNQVTALSQFGDFMKSASSQDAKADVIGAATSAAFGILSKAVLGQFSGLAESLAASVMGFSEAETESEEEPAEEPSDESAEQAAKKKAAPGANTEGNDLGRLKVPDSKKAPGADSQVAPGAEVPSGIPRAPRPAPEKDAKDAKPKSKITKAACLAAGKKAYGAMAEIFGAVQGEINRAATAGKEVEYRDFIVNLKDAISEGYKEKLSLLGPNLTDTLAKAALDLGPGMNPPEKAWKPGNRLCFDQQAAFMNALRTQGQMAIEHVPGTSEFLAGILNEWTAKPTTGPSEIEIGVTVGGEGAYNYRLDYATVKGARAGQLCDMYSKIMAKTGRKVTELGVPVFVKFAAPTFSGMGTKDYRVRYLGPQSVDSRPPGLSQGAWDRWMDFPTNRIDDLKKLG